MKMIIKEYIKEDWIKKMKIWNQYHNPNLKQLKKKIIL